MSTVITNFNTFIAQRNTGIPYSTQWMIHFDIPAGIAENLRSADTQVWRIINSSNTIIQAIETNSNDLQGNALAQAVTVPSEKLDFGRVGMESEYRGGFNQTPIIKSRNDNELLTIDFLETRNSFVDLVIRPWIILVGSQGLVPISDDPTDSIKTELWALFFDRGDSQQNTAPAIRKKWVFHNAVPVSCDASTTDYQKNQIATNKTQWLYSHYTIEVPDDVSTQGVTSGAGLSLTPGSLNNILPFNLV